MENPKNIIEQITELKEKANRYDNARERYIEYGKRINEAIEILNGVLDEINPFIKDGPAREKSNKKFKEILEEIYNKMLSGLNVTAELLETTYNLEGNEKYYLMQKLKGLNGVLERKEGKKLTLYIQKEI